MKVIGFLKYRGIACFSTSDPRKGLQEGDVTWDVEILACLNLPRVPAVGEHLHVPESCHILGCGGSLGKGFGLDTVESHFISDSNDVFRVNGMCMMFDPSIGHFQALLLGKVDGSWYQTLPDTACLTESAPDVYPIEAEDEESGFDTRKEQAQSQKDLFINGTAKLKEVGVHVFSPCATPPEETAAQIIRAFLAT